MALVWKSAATAVNHLFISAQPVKKTQGIRLGQLACKLHNSPGDAVCQRRLLLQVPDLFFTIPPDLHHGPGCAVAVAAGVLLAVVLLNRRDDQ